MSPSFLLFHGSRRPGSSSRWRLVALALLTSLAVAAEDPAPPAPNEPAAVQPSSPAPEAPASASDTPATPPPPALTAQDFLRLWQESKLEDNLLRQRPPAQGVIRSAAYTATVVGQATAPTGLMVQANLQLQSLQKGWSLVPISAGPLPVVKSETGNAFLTLKDQGYVILLPEEGTYQVHLTLAFPVELVEGTPTADVLLPQSPVSTFNGNLPGQGWTVQTTRNLFPVRLNPEGSDTGFSFSPGAHTAFQLQWEKPEDNKANEPVLFAETEIKTHIRPDAVRSEAAISIQLPRAPVSSCKILFSTDHEMLSIAGDALKSWKLEKKESLQSLEIWFATPRKDRSQLQLSLEQNIPQLPFSASLPVIRVEGALRQGGHIEVVEEQDVTTTLDGLQNLTRQATDFRPAAHQRHLGSYRFLKGDYGAGLKIVETTPQISVTADTLFRIDDKFSSFSTTLRQEVQGRAILQSSIVLPAGFELEKVQGEALRGHELKGSRLSVVYLRPQLEAVQLELTGRKARREGAVEELELPHFTVENALDFRGRIRLDVPPSIQLEIRNEASPMALRPAPGSFDYVGSPAPSSLVVTRKAPHVEAVSVTEISFRHHETIIECSLDFQIRNRFPDRLLLRVPASLAGSVEFKSPTLSVIDRKASVNPASTARAEDDSLYAYWALHDPNQTLGEHHVELRIQDRLPDPLYNQPLITPSLLIVPLAADRLDGKVSVTMDENVVLKPVTENDLAAVSGEPAAPGRGPSFEFSTPGADLTFAVTRLRYVELPALAVDLADVTHVVSGDGSISSEIAYRVIADQAADLEIQLPPGARMNSQVFCNEVPIAPRQTNEENLVAVTIRPEKKEGDPADTLVRFTYDVPSALPAKSLDDRGKFAIPVASLRNARTLDSRTTLYLPPAYRYFGFATPMTLQTNDLGWTRAKRYLAKLLPSLASWASTGSEVQETAATVAPIPAFDYRIPLRKEGQKFTFLHSAAPDSTTVSYLSQRYATLLEAGAFFLALFLGILISRKALEAKLVFLVFGGALALVAASFAAPHLAAIYYAVCLGALSSVVFWLFAGVISLFQGIRMHAPANAAPEYFPPFSQSQPPEPAPEPSYMDETPPPPEPERIPAEAPSASTSSVPATASPDAATPPSSSGESAPGAGANPEPQEKKSSTDATPVTQEFPPAQPASSARP